MLRLIAPRLMFGRTNTSPRRANTRFAPTAYGRIPSVHPNSSCPVGANLVFALFEEVFALLGDIFALLGDVFALPNIRRGAIRRSISRCDWATHENIFSPAR